MQSHSRRSKGGKPVPTSPPTLTGVLRRKSHGSWHDYFYALFGFILIEYKCGKISHAHASKPNKIYSLDQYQFILIDDSTFSLWSPADTIYFRSTDEHYPRWVAALRLCCPNPASDPPSGVDEDPKRIVKTFDPDKNDLQMLFQGVASEVEVMVCRTLDESLSIPWSEVLAVNVFLRNQLHQIREEALPLEEMNNRLAPPSPSSQPMDPQEQTSAAPESSFKPNRIEIGSRLHDGGGSGASIHLATIDGWHCVVKELQCNSLSPDVCARFEKELATLESLPSHENLSRYLFHNRTPTHFQIFTTRYDTTLTHVMSDRIQFRQQFTLPEIIGAVLDITRGVEILHRHEIVHRDLKPDNIFVSFDRDGCVRRYIVGDFDSAKNIRLQGEARTFVGTLTHMAPEIFSHMGYGIACDIWSIGIILYEFLTFTLRSSQNVTFATMFGQKSTCLELDAKRYPPSFSDIIDIFERCHQITPSLRPTATSLVRLLHDCRMKANGPVDIHYSASVDRLSPQPSSGSLAMIPASTITASASTERTLSLWKIEKEIRADAGITCSQVRHVESKIRGMMKHASLRPRPESLPGEAELCFTQTIHLKQEAEILKLLDHPNVVKLCDFFGEPNHGWYLVTELIDGEPLSDRRLSFPDHRVPEALARRWFRQLVSGIQYCHDRGIVHRDLRLEILQIDTKDHLWIGGFGVAKYSTDPNFYFKTLCPSAKYAPPESFAGGMYRGPPADVWALGIILFIMLSGQLPWKTEAVGYQLMNEVKSGRFQLPSSISEQPASIIKSILLIDPDDRLTASQLMSHPWITN